MIIFKHKNPAFDFYFLVPFFSFLTTLYNFITIRKVTENKIIALMKNYKFIIIIFISKKIDFG